MIIFYISSRKKINNEGNEGVKIYFTELTHYLAL